MDASVDILTLPRLGCQCLCSKLWNRIVDFSMVRTRHLGGGILTTTIALDCEALDETLETPSMKPGQGLGIA